MATNLKITNAVLTLSIIAACGSPAAAQQARPNNQSDSLSNSKVSSKASSSQKLSAIQKVDIARQSMDLSPADVQLMERAVAQPMLFVEKKNDQEFTGELLVHAHESTAPAAMSRIVPSMKKSSQFVNEYVVKVPAGITEGELAAMLMATGDYLFVEPNWKLFPLLTPNDSQFGSSWQHTRLQSTSAWNLHTGDSDIIVAVCDSGVDTDHPDLQNALVPGYNAVDNLAQANGGQVEDVNGHGSFVSGCAAAQGNNGTGVVGVGWNLSIMPIRVSNNSSGTASSFDILEGARWAVLQGAHAINASFSGGTSGANQTTAKYIIDRGGLLFWASGNDNSFVGFDGADLVMVGSTTSSDNKSGFSNFGTAVDVSAPGSSVRSTRRGGGYGNGSGTSYASPIAAGVGAMIFSVRSDLSGQDAQDILYRSVDDLGAPGRDDSFGRGRVNTFKAMQTALAYQPRIGLPLSESFDSASWTDLLDTTSGSPTTAPDAESTGDVLILSSTDQVTTKPLGGRTLPIGIPSLAYQFKAAGPEAGESFGIQYLLEDGTWTQLLNYTSTGNDTDGYLPVAITVPVDFLWHGTELRFTANGSDASDQWMIDDLFIGTLVPAPEAPFVESFEAGVVSALLWETIDGPTVEVVNNSHAAMFIGEQLIESITIPMVQFGVTPGYVRFDAWTNAQASADDALTIEVLDVFDRWQLLGTLDGQSLTTNPENYQYETPLTAWLSDTLQLRISSEGNDPIYIDNVYVGPDELTSACSPADLNSDGELDFLDISAFLAAFGDNSPEADFNNDGQYDFLDISIFLDAFTGGCP